MKLEYLLTNGLVKVFSDEKPDAPAFTKCSMLQNERLNAQVVCCVAEDTAVLPVLSGSLAAHTTVCVVREIPSQMPVYEDSDDYYLRREAGLFPDLLEPVTDAVTLLAGKWYSFWLELDPGEALTGAQTLTVQLQSGGETLGSCTLDVEILAAKLPANALICTNWFHTDCLMNWYKVEAFSEEYWRIVENYARTAVRHGVNFLLTPLVTPPLDTFPGGQRPTVQLVDVTVQNGTYTFGFEKLSRWVEMCNRCGVQYFEMSHLFTQWGALFAPKIMATVDGEETQIFGWETDAGGPEYTGFLRAFAPQLIAFIDKAGIRERCYFHVSDEPGEKDLESYKQRAALMDELFGAFPIIDALSDFAFYEQGITKIPIPANNEAEHFVGKVPQFWTYYCCGQHKDYVSNRLFAMPGERTRVLGYQLFSADAVGFLQWGYNYWYTRFSLEEIDPYKVSDAGEAFVSGDAYAVYPAADGTALCSLRLKQFYDAIQDFAALRLLEGLVGREKTLALLTQDVEGAFNFKQYPHSATWLLQTRENINRAIAEAI